VTLIFSQACENGGGGYNWLRDQLFISVITIDVRILLSADRAKI